MEGKARRYGIALLTSVATLCVVVLLSLVLPFEPFLLFAVPVSLTSRYAGRGPTGLAVILCAIGMEATMILETGRFRFSVTELWIHAGLFAVVAWAIDSTTEALRKARREAERTAEHLEDTNVELEQQMDQVQTLSEDLQRANRSLATARDVAEDTSRAREDMLGVVAHDLRNPLNLMMMTTQVIADTDPTGERRDQLIGVMVRAAHRMNRLIDDLLEVVRQESGKMRLDLGEVSVESLLTLTTEAFQTIAADHGISLVVKEAPLGLVVRGDSERIMQVMANLVGNAMKFVPSGGKVDVKCERKGTDALCSVADTGPGIPPEDLDRLFEKFWQRRRTDKRGVGLGLAIARGIVEAHGGRIWVESTVGVGSTFFFTLPALSERKDDLHLATVGVDSGSASNDSALWATPIPSAMVG